MTTFIDLEEACKAACIECRYGTRLSSEWDHLHVDGAATIPCAAAPLRRLRRWEVVKAFARQPDEVVIAPAPGEGGER